MLEAISLGASSAALFLPLFGRNLRGRYSIAAEPEVLEERFGTTFAERTERRYNAAPSQALPVILNADQEHIRLVSWGIDPWWLKRSRGEGLINVRVETVRTRFKDDLAERRCLVLADGFYEWAKTTDGRVPYRFVLRDRSPFAFAGVWEKREDALGVLPSFAILTTAADAAVAPIHSRMPVILPRALETGIGWRRHTQGNPPLRGSCAEANPPLSCR